MEITIISAQKSLKLLKITLIILKIFTFVQI